MAVAELPNSVLTLGVGLSVFMVVALTGCSEQGDGSPVAKTPIAGASSAASPPASTAPSDEPVVLQGGEPGAPASEVTNGLVAPVNDWTHEDVMFMQMMIPHHAQALEMSRLAPSRAEDPRVRRLAERILAAQGPEIGVMAGWLADRKLEVPRAGEDPSRYDHSEHGHIAMAGMLSPTQFRALRASSGVAFDRLFLSSMIKHHQGAIQMAQQTALGGTDVRVGELRDDVSSSQEAEIDRMQSLLRAL